MSGVADTQRWRLDGMTAVVTGGTQGLGLAITRAFVDAGANVMAASRSEHDVGKVIAEHGDNADFHPVDVADPSSVEELMAATVRRFDQLDIVVANAGVTRNRMIGKLDTSDWRDVMRTNVDGVFHTVRAAVPHLGRQGGTIVTVSSAMSQRIVRGASAYITSKSAIEAFTRCCAVELSGRGIRANCLSPGILSIGMGAVLAADERLRALYWPRMLAGRPGHAEEAVSAALFLASSASSYVNGHVLEVSGGLL